MTTAEIRTIELGHLRLRTATWGDGPTGIVMLHDGLGSIGQWRDVPAAIAQSTGVAVMAYERAGHGLSEPQPSGAWPADWLHLEAAVLGDLLRATNVERPLVVGHSDGGTIALVHAADGGTCAGVVALAAHTWVEQVCRDAITEMRLSPARFIAGLASHHANPAALFEAWSAVWVSDEFASWDVRPTLGSVDLPALIVQGDRDLYATEAQLAETAAAIGANASVEYLADTGHIIHHEQPAAVTALVSDFYDQIQHR